MCALKSLLKYALCAVGHCRYTTKIIQRDRLAGALFEEIESKYSSQVQQRGDGG